MTKAHHALVFSIVLIFGQSAIAQTKKQGPKDLNWLVGKWVSETTNIVISENWEVLNDSMLVGSSSTLKDGNVVFSEKLAIEFRYSGCHYVADLGFKLATFTLDSMGDQRFTFIDPQNDFPSRINYARAGQTLTITLEGSGQTESIILQLK